MSVVATILAAGRGTRLGNPFPKPLTPLRDGRTIMQQQVENLRRVLPDPRIHIVLGFMPEDLLKAQPDALFVYNPDFASTNTSKSLLRALRATGESGVLWLNGDVVFHHEILERVLPLIEQDQSFVCVNTDRTAEEEVKYTVDDDGYIREISKTVEGALGEAIGINYVSSADKPSFERCLEAVDDNDYFEGGIEQSIREDATRFLPIDISDLWAVEVDFAEDLDRANAHL